MQSVNIKLSLKGSTTNKQQAKITIAHKLTHSASASISCSVQNILPNLSAAFRFLNKRCDNIKMIHAFHPHTGTFTLMRR